MSAMDDLREAFLPLVEHELAQRGDKPGVSDQPCCNCGLTWYCDTGRDGEVYCQICLGRDRDLPDEPTDPSLHPSIPGGLR
jgi:hypothetical protein